MKEKREERFEVRPGAPRGTGSAPSFVRRVRSIAHKSGAMVGRTAEGAKRSRPGPRHGRGRVAARVAGSSFGLRSRRVAAKVRHVKIRGKASTTATHVRYLEREGAGADSAPGKAYGRDADQVDTQAFAEACAEDRHQFRLIVSPEDGAELEDLKAFTRSLMGQMEVDLQTRLEWVAVDHWDTGHPHTHVLLRGKDQDGSDLLIDRAYLTQGLRMRASELATEWLGPRTQLEIEADWNRQVTAERWTGIDGLLDRHAVDGTLKVSALADLDAPARARCVQRLQTLARMGLAEQLDDDGWRLAKDRRLVLHEMGERGDIIRTLQKTHARSIEYQILDPGRDPHAVVGRIAGKGLHDEMSDQGYLLIEALDGQTHYVPLAESTPLSEFPVGGIVRVTPVGERQVDRNIAAAARDGIYRTHEHQRQVQARGETGIDPEEYIQSHVRRLEALRRARIVDRIEEGVWRVPADLTARGLEYERQQRGWVEIRLVSPMPIERQRQALGATWLDQQLIASTQPPASEFGRQLASALQVRQEALIKDGLAQRQGPKVLPASNLLSRLKERELDAMGAALARSTGLYYRPTSEGDRVAGTYRQNVQLASGKVAMLDDGVGFSLVPWRPMLDKHLGQSLSATVYDSRVSWEIGRSRGRSI